MRRFFFLAFLPLLSGCGAKDSPLVRDVARAVLTARAYDDALKAVRQDDSEALAQSIDKLIDAGRIQDVFGSNRRLLFSEYFVEVAFNTEIVLKESAAEERRSVQNKAAQNYRRALAITPDFPSKNPQILNALGYFLADKGSSREDFLKAEDLTRRAIALYKSKTPDAYRANTRDSLAWALFKLGRLEEAEKEQREAIREARETKNMGAELTLHLGEILAKSGKKDEARAALKETLTLVQNEPDAHERARKLLDKL